MSHGAEVPAKPRVEGQSFVVTGGGGEKGDLIRRVQSFSILGEAKLCRMRSWEQNNKVDLR